MSYTSVSRFPKGTSLTKVTEVVELLGYRRVRDPLQVADRIHSMVWYDDTDFRSYTGVELSIYRNTKGELRVETRSTASRSYWDLKHQNRTLKLLRSLIGGDFLTDAGRNRYWHPEGEPPRPIFSGCYLARWQFHNASIKPFIYLDFRKLEGNLAKEVPTGFDLFDEFNPRLFSNNLVIPYIAAIWEDYFRSSFVALLKYTARREAVFKRARFTQQHLEAIATTKQSVEEAFADSLTFQRPSTIHKNYCLLDPGLDLAGSLRKPYRRRSVSLYKSIEAYIDIRNEFVHAGTMDTTLTDQKLETILEDFKVAVDRAYELFANHYNFTPIRDF